MSSTATIITTTDSSTDYGWYPPPDYGFPPPPTEKERIRKLEQEVRELKEVILELMDYVERN